MKEYLIDKPKQARSFLKWVGGKHQLLSQFEQFYPKSFTRYFEPFVGGGAVFFHLWNTNRLPEQVYLYDNNEELINAFKVVRDKIDDLIQALKTHKEKHSREYFYKIRELDRNGIRLDDVEKAARTIYLNKTCYNGLFRVNRKGQFNVPIGSYKDPQILYEKELKAASHALKNTHIEVKDFRNIVALANKGDFFYFDPPYDPLNKTANFTSYTVDSFNDDDQHGLANVYKELSEKRCYCMLSNSYTPFILELYSEFKIQVVMANRAVNSKGSARGGIKEVVVLNYTT